MTSCVVLGLLLHLSEPVSLHGQSEVMEPDVTAVSLGYHPFVVQGTLFGQSLGMRLWSVCVFDASYCSCSGVPW